MLTRWKSLAIVLAVVVPMLAGPVSGVVYKHTTDPELVDGTPFEVDVPCDDGLCSAVTGENVTFRDMSSGASRRAWNFGVSGVARSGPVVRHSWSSPGFYEVTLTATDSAGFERASSAMFRVEAADPAGSCRTDGETLCLRDSRYEVAAEWRTPGEFGAGSVVRAGTNDSGLFSFFDRKNWEVLVKVLDGCSINGADWVFAASATDLDYDFVVTDTVTGKMRHYGNSSGTLAPAVTDTKAFTDRCIGQADSVKSAARYALDCEVPGEYDQENPASYHCGVLHPHGHAIVLFFTNKMSDVGVAGSYTVYVDGAAHPHAHDIVVDGGGNPNIFWPGLSDSGIDEGQAVAIAYTKPSSGSRLTDVNGNEIASFGPVAVENGIGSPNLDPPPPPPPPEDDPEDEEDNGGGGSAGDDAGNGGSSDDATPDDVGGSSGGDNPDGGGSGGGAAAACAPTALCLHEGRFQVDVEWATPEGEGVAQSARPRTDDSGLFWFFDPDNWEVLVKVLDGCAVNERYWVYAASATDLGLEITVTDTVTKDVRQYTKSHGKAAVAMADPIAFPSGCSP